MRRSETVTPAQRDKALQSFARSIQLREAQAKKSGGGDGGHDHMLNMLKVPPRPTLEVTQGQILSQSPTDATRFWWHLYGS